MATKKGITQTVKAVGPSIQTMSTKVTYKHPATCQCATCRTRGSRK